MGGSSGGHGSGAVDYPDWFDTNCQDAFNALFGYITGSLWHGGALVDDNPYEDLDAYDPTTPIARMRLKADAFGDFVDALDHITDYARILSVGNQLANQSDSIVAPEQVDEAVSQYSLRQRLHFSQAFNRLSGGMADINAVQGSAYLIAKALLEDEYARQVSDFNAQLTLEAMKLKQQYVEKAAAEMFRLLLGLVDAKRNVYAAESEAGRVEITVKQNEIDQNAEYNYKERHWPLELFQYIANMNASVGGGSGMSSQEWRTSQKSWNIL